MLVLVVNGGGVGCGGLVCFCWGDDVKLEMLWIGGYQWMIEAERYMVSCLLYQKFSLLLRMMLTGFYGFWFVSL